MRGCVCNLMYKQKSALTLSPTQCTLHSVICGYSPCYRNVSAPARSPAVYPFSCSLNREPFERKGGMLARRATLRSWGRERRCRASSCLEPGRTKRVVKSGRRRPEFDLQWTVEPRVDLDGRSPWWKQLQMNTVVVILLRRPTALLLLQCKEVCKVCLCYRSNLFPGAFITFRRPTRFLSISSLYDKRINLLNVSLLLSVMKCNS